MSQLTAPAVSPSRARRCLLNLAAAVSLAFCVASAAAWCLRPARLILWSWAPPLDHGLTPEQQRARMDRLGTTGSEIQWMLRADRGRLLLERLHYGDPALRNRPGKTWERGRWGLAAGERFFVAPVSGGTFVPGSIRWFSVPVWMLTLASAVLPAVVARAILLRTRTRVRLARGLCTRCGYDLRATPDRCPECGATPRASGG